MFETKYPLHVRSDKKYGSIHRKLRCYCLILPYSPETFIRSVNPLQPLWQVTELAH